MDLVDEILKFSSVIRQQEDNPLRAGLVFRRFDEIETHSDYDNSESNTTIGLMEGDPDHEAMPQKVGIHQKSFFEHWQTEQALNMAD